MAEKLNKITYRWLIATALLLVPVALSLMPFVVNFGYYPTFLLFMFGVIPISFILTLLSVFVISKVQKKTSKADLFTYLANIFYLVSSGICCIPCFEK